MQRAVELGSVIPLRESGFPQALLFLCTQVPWQIRYQEPISGRFVEENRFRFLTPFLAQSPPRPEQERLKAIVTKLASPEMEGRRGEGARKAAAFLIDEFRRLSRWAGSLQGVIPGATRP